MKKQFLLILLAFFLICLAGCANDAPAGSSHSYHTENLTTLTKFFNSSVAESVLDGLEKSCVIDSDTKLIKEDIIRYSDDCFDIYVELTVRIKIQDNQVKIYTFNTVYDEQSAILLYDSADMSTVKILTTTEREGLIHKQREYVVQNTLQISPNKGFLFHNVLGGTKIEDLTFTNFSDTDMAYVTVIITPYLGGSAYTSRNASYTLPEELGVGRSVTEDLTLTKSDWSNFDSYQITEVTIVFADGSTIGFDSFDCQFLEK